MTASANSGWSARMDRKLEAMRNDPQAYFIAARKEARVEFSGRKEGKSPAPRHAEKRGR